MKRLFLPLFFFCLSLASRSQLTVEDASGKSSVNLQQSNLAFDFSATSGRFSFNNFHLAKFERPHQTLWGLDLRGELTGGLNQLISSGNISTGSRLTGFIGFMGSGDQKENMIDRDRIELEKRRKKLKSEKPTPQVIAEITLLTEQIDRKVDELISYRKKDDYRFTRRFFYLSPFLNANTFRRYNEAIPGDLKNRFPKERFRGGGFDIGLNEVVSRRIIWGVSVGYERANTIDSLEDRESIVRTSTTVNTQTIIDDKKFTVKDGTYVVHSRLNIKTDLLYYGKIDTSFRFVWNVFFTRWHKAISHTDEVKDVFVLGSGVNFFKSREAKFVGGVYLQSSDLFNNVSNEQDFFRRLNFGLTAKFVFGSIINGGL